MTRKAFPLTGMTKSEKNLIRLSWYAIKNNCLTQVVQRRLIKATLFITSLIIKRKKITNCRRFKKTKKIAKFPVIFQFGSGKLKIYFSKNSLPFASSYLHALSSHIINQLLFFIFFHRNSDFFREYSIIN